MAEKYLYRHKRVLNFKAGPFKFSKGLLRITSDTIPGLTADEANEQWLQVFAGLKRIDSGNIVRVMLEAAQNEVSVVVRGAMDSSHGITQNETAGSSVIKDTGGARGLGTTEEAEAVTEKLQVANDEIAALKAKLAALESFSESTEGSKEEESSTQTDEQESSDTEEADDSEASEVTETTQEEVTSEADSDAEVEADEEDVSETEVDEAKTNLLDRLTAKS